MTTTRTRRPGTNRAGMKLRQAWTPTVATGTITCRRCHQPIRPGQKWELGHPIDRPYAAGNHSEDLAPEHSQCNKTGLVTENKPTFAW